MPKDDKVSKLTKSPELKGAEAAMKDALEGTFEKEVRTHSYVKRAVDELIGVVVFDKATGKAIRCRADSEIDNEAIDMAVEFSKYAKEGGLATEASDISKFHHVLHEFEETLKDAEGNISTKQRKLIKKIILVYSPAMLIKMQASTGVAAAAKVDLETAMKTFEKVHNIALYDATTVAQIEAELARTEELIKESEKVDRLRMEIAAGNIALTAKFDEEKAKDAAGAQELAAAKAETEKAQAALAESTKQLEDQKRQLAALEEEQKELVKKTKEKLAAEKENSQGPIRGFFSGIRSSLSTLYPLRPQATKENVGSSSNSQQ